MYSSKLRFFIIGNDRVVDFQYGSGDSMNHLIIELYNNGNIILTDANYEVIVLLRTHQFADDINLKVGEIYPISFTTNTFTNSTTITTTQDECLNNDSTSDNVTGIKELNVDKFLVWASTRLHENQLYHAMNNHEALTLHNNDINNDNDDNTPNNLSNISSTSITTIPITKPGKKLKRLKNL